MHYQKLTPDDRRIWQELAAALAESWQGRAVTAQLGADRTAGVESLRALLTSAPSPTLANLVSTYGIDRLVNIAGVVAYPRFSRPMLAGGCVLAVVLIVTVAVVTLSGGQSGGTAVAPTPTENRSHEASPPASGTSSTPRPSATAAAGSLDNARRVQFTENGFSYEARAVMMRTLTDGAESARPSFHKLLFVFQIHNLQKDRPAPVPVITSYTAADIHVPRQFVLDSDSRCAYPFREEWSSLGDAENSNSRCNLSLKPAAQRERFQFSDLRILADRAVTFNMITEGDVPDTVPDSTISLTIENDGEPGTADADHVDVPLR
ncbi:hypothetical protein MXD63_13920 [Frankia sp. Cpl3]|nr:hypothetical protein [Frankia sp. Cpl3]